MILGPYKKRKQAPFLLLGSTECRATKDKLGTRFITGNTACGMNSVNWTFLLTSEHGGTTSHHDVPWTLERDVISGINVDECSEQMPSVEIW